MRRSGTALARAKFLGNTGIMAALLVVAACSLTSGEPPDELRGTVLTARDVAPPFTLLNQAGMPTSLSDFRGKVVLLTFLYTNCPDVCPITTNQLRDTYEALGETANEAAIVAISVDPERDTVEVALDYSERWKMTDRWSYLVGADAELAPIWKAYYLDPASLRPSADIEAAVAAQENQQAAGIDALVQESFLIIHSAPIYLIDREGRLRVVFTQPFETADLIHDVQYLTDNGLIY